VKVSESQATSDSSQVENTKSQGFTLPVQVDAVGMVLVFQFVAMLF
jgi:hypothetical protein